MRAQRAQAASGRRGMVVSGHGDATQAAWRTLDAGGSVADAAIAGAAVLAVTQPQACTIGGDAFVLLHHHGKTTGLNGSGPAPALTSFGKEIAQRGAQTANVPGVVAGWEALHKRAGKLPWKDLLQPAIALAREGCAVSRVLARSSEVYASLLGGTAFENLKPGERLAQPALARTLETLARDGAQAFYEGAIAQSLGRASEAQGGFLRAADFRGYAPEWVEPIEVGYRGHRVRAMPPNSYGLYLLLQLLSLEDEELKGEAIDSPRRIVALVKAARAAFAVGNRAVADPKSGEPFAPLLGDVGRQKLRSARGADAPNLGGTAVISVVDAAGDAVTLVQSVFLVFGSGAIDTGTGILLSNRMIGFTTEAGHPNQAAPGKRPAHTLCPCQVFDAKGELRYALGTPGGPGQTLTIAHVIQAVLDGGASLEDAISAPRWSQDLGSQALVEDGMPQATVEGAKRMGVELAKAQPNAPFFGSAEAIERSANGLQGVADYRRDASAHGQ